MSPLRVFLSNALNPVREVAVVPVHVAPISVDTAIPCIVECMQAGGGRSQRCVAMGYISISELYAICSWVHYLLQVGWTFIGCIVA